MNDFTEIWQLQDAITTSVNACGYGIWTCTQQTQDFIWNSQSTWMMITSTFFAISCHWLPTTMDRERMAPYFACTGSVFAPK